MQKTDYMVRLYRDTDGKQEMAEFAKVWENTTIPEIVEEMPAYCHNRGARSFRVFRFSIQPRRTRVQERCVKHIQVS